MVEHQIVSFLQVLTCLLSEAIDFFEIPLPLSLTEIC